MAAGATSMALVAAAILGISLAIHRRTRGHRGTRPADDLDRGRLDRPGPGHVPGPLARHQRQRAVTRSAARPPSAHPTPLVALFFAAIYLISGACTIFEAERLYNPEYFAFVRLGKQHQQQAQKAAEAEATVDRARSAVDHHDGELDREDHRRQAAIGERQALGAEAANYARLLMAGMLRDPAQTGLTEVVPVRSSHPLSRPGRGLPRRPIHAYPGNRPLAGCAVRRRPTAERARCYSGYSRSPSPWKGQLMRALDQPWTC